MILDIRIGREYRDSIRKYTDEQLDAAGTVEIPWEPSAADRMGRHPNTRFVLFAPDARAAAQAADRLGRGMDFDAVALESGRLALAGKGTRRWGDIAAGLGPVGARALVLRLVARAIERGNNVHAMVPVVEDILMGGARAADADILVQSWGLR